MNGLVKINIAGKATQLTFGMMAVEEIGNRQATGNPGWFKLITDIVYAGYMNDQYLNGTAPELTYRQISESVDEMISTEDAQLAEVFKVFSESKAGQKLIESVAKVVGNKKKAKEITDTVPPKQKLQVQTGRK